MKNQWRKISHRARIDDSLGELRGVLADISQRRGRNPFQSDLWLLNAEYEQWDSARINNMLRKFWVRKLTLGWTISNDTNGTSKPGVCWAMYPMAQAAASFTVGSNSSRHGTRVSSAFESTTACARSGECFATALSTKAAAFL
jgi:hypothetical protein